mmetsp:Transcript_1878/g.2988  ORF Transcript_1878/g.2988 Transcript_1878/m.2988 type:complete len:156 (+) Transcript_1878:85-552(+)
MPKIQKLRKYKLTKQTEPYNNTKHSHENDVDDNNIQQHNDILNRGQRKRQKHKERVMRKLGKLPLEGFKTAPVKKSPDFKFLLSELEAALPSGENSVVRPAAVSVKSNKMKKSVAIRETERMKLVQQHPSFKEDPIAAMKTHIEHMIAMKKKGNE